MVTSGDCIYSKKKNQNPGSFYRMVYMQTHICTWNEILHILILFAKLIVNINNGYC